MRIGIIGCGVMGGAMARILSKHHELTLHDHKKTNAAPLAKETGAKIEPDPEKLAINVDYIILAVKPKDLKVVSESIAPHLNKNQVVISILSGKTLQTLKQHFRDPFVFRVMPNLPLLCGRGMLGIADDPLVSKEMKQNLEDALKELGAISWLKEELFDAFTVLTSSNPAYIYLIIESMIQGAVTLGFKPDTALTYLLETIEGSIALLKHTQLSPTELKMRITSPSGTTIAGLNELENRGVRTGIIEGLQACYRRTLELGES